MDSKKHENEIKFNEFKIRENNKKIDIIEKNSIVGKFEHFARAFLPCYLIFCLINMTSLVFIPPYIIIPISVFMGVSTTASKYLKNNYKKKLRSFTHAKKEKDLIKERIKLESEIRYLEFKNQALKNIDKGVYENSSSNTEETLESIDKKMNVLSIKMILDEMFMGYRKEYNKVFKDTIFYYSIGVVIFFLLYNIPNVLAHISSEINVFNIFIPSFLFTLGINRYETMLKKVYENINSSLGDDALPEDMLQEGYFKNKLKELIEQYANKYKKEATKENSEQVKSSNKTKETENLSNVEYLSGPKRIYELTNNKD